MTVKALKKKNNMAFKMKAGKISTRTTVKEQGKTLDQVNINQKTNQNDLFILQDQYNDQQFKTE